MPRRVYLAGPDVFLPDPQQHAAEMKVVCSEFGLEGVFPLDADLVFEPDESLLSRATQIFHANRKLIQSCQGVLANMIPFRGPSTDAGTAWEMGFADAYGLPIVGYTINPMSYSDRVRHFRFLIEDYNPEDKAFFDPTFVENFGLHDNLMLDCSARMVHPSFRDAVRYMGMILPPARSS